MEKMPSASNSPMLGRKVSSEDVNAKRGQPLSVASMVRRFERDQGLDKNRGGELERSNSNLNKSALLKESRSSSRTSSLSSSQGHLVETGNQPQTGSHHDENTEKQDVNKAEKAEKKESVVKEPVEEVASELKKSEVNETSSGSEVQKKKASSATTAKPASNRTVRHFFLRIYFQNLEIALKVRSIFKGRLF